MIKKRITIFVLIFVLLLESTNVMAQSEENNQQTSGISTEVELTTGDSFGAMTADLIDGKITEQEENDGCNIFSIDINGTQADVYFETNQFASLIVAIYDEAGDQMIASGSLEVAPGDENAEIEIETEQMPEYFYLRGFLVDYMTFEPYCTAYESPVYTKEMQEFLGKTVKDFDGHEILNFDTDNKNNFAVYNDDTTVVEEAEGKNNVVQVDEENQVYVIENVDETVTSLKKGDIFSYEYDDGTVLIIKVFNVELDGTTAQITGEEASLEEVFDYVKIDTQQFADSAEIDPSTCDEGVTYDGVEKSYTTRGVDLDFEKSESVTLKLDKQIGESVNLTGSLKLKMGASLKLYVTWTYQYVELKMDYSAGISASFSGKCDKLSIKLVNVAFIPVPGIIVDVTPSFVAEVSGKVELSGTLKGRIGFSVSSDKGIKNLTKNPTFDTELKGEMTVFIGLDLKPKVKIIDDSIAKVEIGAEVGAELKAEQSAEKEDTGPIIHECRNCFDGDVTAKCELSFGVNLLGIFEHKLTKGINVKITDFYWSIDYDEFAFTTCPHILYRVTVNVKDFEGNEVDRAQVNEKYITDSNGRTSFYLPEGKHKITVKKQELEKKKTIYVKDAEVKVTIKFDEVIDEAGDQEEENRAKVIAVDMEQYYGAALLDDGSLWTWGGNFYGELGTGRDDIYYQRSPVKILEHVKSFSLGFYGGAAVKTDGTLWAWGENDYGEFGNGTTDGSTIPIKIASDVSSVEVGTGFMAVLKTDGTLWAAGHNGYGQLGDKTTEFRATPVKVLENVKEISLGNFHSAAIKMDGSLWIWGRNNKGQLGDGTTQNHFEPFKLMDDVKSVNLGTSESTVIKTDGSLWAWGNNDEGQIGVSNDNYQADVVTTPIKVMDNVSSASISGETGAAIKADGNLWMWGGKQSGNTYDKKQNTVKQLVDVNVLDISLCTKTVAMLRKDNTLWTWGYNGHGQAGTGTSELNIEAPVNITGSFTESNYENILSSNISLAASQLETDLPDTAIPITNLDVLEDGTAAATVDGLCAGDIYNLYTLKSLNAENVFAGGNLLYIRQAEVDENGVIKIPYYPVENYEQAQLFAVKMRGMSDSSGDITEPGYTLGDLDESGKVDIADLRAVLRAVCGKVNLTEQQNLVADVDLNSVVNIVDLRLILRYVCGKINKL